MLGLANADELADTVAKINKSAAVRSRLFWMVKS